MQTKTRNVLIALSLLGAVLMPVAHTAVLLANGQNAVQTPISALSRGRWADFHTVALILFGCAHVFLAIALGGLDRGRLWPWGRALLVASGATLVYVAYYFATSSTSDLAGANANDPLWIVASMIGVAMGALQPGLARLARGLGLYSTVCLGVWLWLVPLILLVNDSWLGAYERIVGIVYIAWMAGVAIGLLRVDTGAEDVAGG